MKVTFFTASVLFLLKGSIKSNLLIDKIGQSIVYSTALHSLMVFNRIIGTKTVRLSPKLIHLDNIVLDISSKLQIYFDQTLNKNYVFIIKPQNTYKHSR